MFSDWTDESRPAWARELKRHNRVEAQRMAVGRAPRGRVN